MFKFWGTIFFLLVPTFSNAADLNSIKFQARNITVSSVCGNPQTELAEIIFIQEIMSNLSPTNTEEVYQVMYSGEDNLKITPPTSEDCKLSNEIIETLILRAEIQHGEILILKKGSLVGSSFETFPELKKIYTENPADKNKIRTLGGAIIPPSSYDKPYYVYLMNKQESICQIQSLGDANLAWTDCKNLLHFKDE